MKARRCARFPSGDRLLIHALMFWISSFSLFLSALPESCILAAPAWRVATSSGPSFGEKFIANPFSSGPGEKLYKTGDLVRYRADGNLEFLGRVDNQIKIRGFRVELEEIEGALRSHVGVSDCVVILREDRDGDKRLVAYVVAAKESVAISELRNFLKTKLPSYMVPAGFEMIESLPLMPNGKIDRRALPEPNATGPEPDELFVPPRTPLEPMLADPWRAVLT